MVDGWIDGGDIEAESTEVAMATHGQALGVTPTRTEGENEKGRFPLP